MQNWPGSTVSIQEGQHKDYTRQVAQELYKKKQHKKYKRRAAQICKTDSTEKLSRKPILKVPHAIEHRNYAIKAAKELYKKKQHKKGTRHAEQKKGQERQYNKYDSIGSMQERQQKSNQERQHRSWSKMIKRCSHVNCCRQQRGEARRVCGRRRLSCRSAQLPAFIAIASNYFLPVLRIYDILVWIRILIRGSMPLTNGSGSVFRSCYFHHWPSIHKQKTNFKKVFLHITFWRYISIIFQR